MENEKANKIIELLEEIRNLQSQSMENYQHALKNQEESISLQKAAVGRFRNVIFPIVLIAIIGVIIALFLVLRILMRY